MQIKFHSMSKNLLRWLYSNSKIKKIVDVVKTKLSSKRIYPATRVKYLSVKIDKNIIWQDHGIDLSNMLNMVNDLVFKIKKFFDD